MAKVDYQTKKRANNAYVVCDDCGEKHGRGVWMDGVLQTKTSLSTYHRTRCDICFRKKMVTEFRDFGYSKYADENLEDQYENDD